MAGATFTLDLTALGAVTAGLARKMGQDRQALMKTLGAMNVSQVMEKFKTSTGPDGKAWEASDREGKILVDTARLRNSIGYEASSDTVLIGTNVEYGAIHQFGGKAGRGHSVTLPARPYLGTSEADLEELQEEAADWLQRGLR